MGMRGCVRRPGPGFLQQSSLSAMEARQAWWQVREVGITVRVAVDAVSYFSAGLGRQQYSDSFCGHL